MAYKRALVVDDSKLARITLKKKLEQREVQVDMVESAQLALDYLQSNRPDIIFMDHLMPEIDGFEATQRIKADPGTQDIPVIMCSGKENTDYLQEARAIGASNILSKPPVSTALDEILAAVTVDQPMPSEAPVMAENPAAIEPAPTEEVLSSSIPPTPPIPPTPVLDEQSIQAVVRDMLPGLLPDTELQREQILAELSHTQTRILEDFTSGVDHQLDSHQQQLSLLKEQLQKSQANVTMDEQTVDGLVEQSLKQQQSNLASQTEESSQRSAEEVAALAVRIQKMEEAHTVFEQRISQWLQEVELRQSEQSEQITAATTAQGSEGQQQDAAIDQSAIVEQISAQVMAGVQENLQQQISAAIEARVPQLSADIGDQLQLQMTYQMNQVEETKQAVDRAQPTVDQAMGVGDAQLKNMVNIALEEQLQRKLADQLSEIKQQMPQQQALDFELIRSQVEEMIRQHEPMVSNAPDQQTTQGADVADELLDQLAQRFTEEKQQLDDKFSRSSMMLGIGLVICLLAIVAQWIG